MSKVNKYNFMRWDNDGTPSTSCEDAYLLPVMVNDTFSFYINFDDPISDVTTNWELGLWIPDDAIVIRNIATISEDDVDGTNHNLYSSFTVGVFPGPWFRLVIYDTADSDAIKYWSSPLRYKTSDFNTFVIKYRNNFSILNFEYENVLSYTNQFRITGRIAEQLATKNTTGYELSSGQYEIAKNIYRKTQEIQTYGFDQYAHEAFYAAIGSSDLYFDDVRHEATEDTYAQDPQGEATQWHGSVRMQIFDYTVVASNT